MNIKRIKAAVIAAATALTALASIPVMNVSATQMTFLQGDVDGDGTSDLSDCILHSKYTAGNYIASNEEVTRMDANQDKVIDASDGNYIMDYALGSATPQSVTMNRYNSYLNNVSMIYLKHDYASSNVNSYTGYNLRNTTTSSRDIPDIENHQDTENINTVKLISHDGYASGFIVDDHVVATAAHCVSRYDNNILSFPQSLSVQILGSNGTSPIATIPAKEIHIPNEYKKARLGNGTNGVDAVNYDYALVYVETDLTQYAGVEAWNIGYMTDEFMLTGDNVTSSGFTDGDSGQTRYFSTGEIHDFTEGDSLRHLRYHIQSHGGGGKSGGPAYYESVYNGTTIKNAVGIHVGSVIDGETGESVDSWGTRITPTIARFWLNNTNIGSN